MAYSCVKVLFEIGHEASIRTKRTPEGFTHDWEVFVRGVENSDIFHFVEKVVFNLHETFPKPKRVIKDPPYSVKESGYAGFNLPIDIYFKNSDEPKKVRFNYDLHLQNTGPPISKVLRQQHVFLNPAEDLRRRLIKGGGVGVLGSESGFHLAASEKLPPPPSSDEAPSHKHTVQTLVGKPKLSGNDSGKKHKVKEGKGDESRVSNSFHELFGPPIKTAKVSPDPKKSSSSHSSPKVSPISKSTKTSDKSSGDKPEKSSKSSKHGSQREGKESAERNSSSSSSKEEKKEKDKNRDKEKNKDKPPKRPSTPVKPASTPPKRPSTPPRRPPSPPKRSASPTKLLAPPPPTKLPTSPKHAPSSKPIKEEPKISNNDDNKSKNESKSGEGNKSEKKKKDKKNRDEKPKKDKHKEKDHDKSSEKTIKSEKSKDLKDKDASKKLEKETIKEPEKSREKDKDKSKHGDGDKEKQRHKHKKKDKSNKDKDREKEREKDKSSKKSSESKITDLRDKDKNGLANDISRGSSETTNDTSIPHKKQAASSPSPSPVRAATSPTKPSPTPEKSVSSVPVKDKIKRPLVSDDSSDSHSSAVSADEDVEPPVSRIKRAKTPESGHVPVENKNNVLSVTEPSRPNSRSEVVKPKSENPSQERNSLNKSSSKQKEKSSKKNKERESGSGDGEKPEKDSKKTKRKRSNRIVEDGECARNNGEAPMKIPKLEVETEELPLDPEPVDGRAAIEEMEVKEESDLEEPPPPPAAHLTEEYVCQLRELQHKIMTLEDNAELQRVVQVIAETGQYEITKKTFDFDLCALDRNTVERLQELFAPS